MKFFLSSIGFTGIDISEKNSKYFRKVFFGKFFQFEKQLKNVFFAKTCVFRRGYRSLWVCYRYGRWCVGNLGPYPFQTRYVWICIVQTDDRIWESKSRIHFVQFLHFSKILLDFRMCKVGELWFVQFFVTSGGWFITKFGCQICRRMTFI